MQKRDRKPNEETEGPGTSSPKEFGIETPELKIEPDEEEVSDVNLVAELDEESDDDDSNGTGLEVASKRESFFDNKISQFEENERIREVDERIVESKDAEGITKSEVSSNACRLNL